MEFFTPEELRCPSTHKIQLANGFQEELVRLRRQFNHPMILTSCCRTEEHNRKIGGHPRSLHVCDRPYHPTGGCMAADVSIADWTMEELTFFMDLCVKNGWSFGLNKKHNFIHIDRRSDINMKQTWFTY